MMKKLIIAFVLLFATSAQATVDDLISSVKQNNLEEVIRLLENGENVNAVNENGETALHYAVALDNAAITEVLLAKGADLNVANKTGWTPLKIAEQKELENVIPVLQNALQVGQNIEKRTNSDAGANVADKKVSAEQNVVTEEKKNDNVQFSDEDMAAYVEVLTRAGDEIAKVRQERDEMAAENKKLGDEIAILKAQNYELEKRLLEIAAKRAEEMSKTEKKDEKSIKNDEKNKVFEAEDKKVEEKKAEKVTKTQEKSDSVDNAAEKKNEDKINDAKSENKKEQSKTTVKVLEKPQVSKLENKIYTGDEEIVYCLNYLGQGTNENMLYAAGYYAAAAKISEERYRKIADVSNDYFISANENDLQKRAAECSNIITPKDAGKQNLIIRSLNRALKY